MSSDPRVHAIGGSSPDRRRSKSTTAVGPDPAVVVQPQSSSQGPSGVCTPSAAAASWSWAANAAHLAEPGLGLGDLGFDQSPQAGLDRFAPLALPSSDEVGDLLVRLRVDSKVKREYGFATGGRT